MKRLYYAAAIVLLTAFIHGCSSSDDESPVKSTDGLSPEEVTILDATADAEGFEPQNIMLPNGERLLDYLEEVNPDFLSEQGRKKSPEELGPQAARNELIAKLGFMATKLVDRSNYQSNGQNGLGYSWGGKDHTSLTAPPGVGTTCVTPLHGLDCSGFIYQVFQASGIVLPTGPANEQRKPEVLEAAIKAAYPNFKKLKVEDLGQIPVAKFETGDVIYWLNGETAFHIGVILKDENGMLAVYQSNGSIGKNNDDCEKNMSDKRGPRKLALTDPYWFANGKSYGIVRFNAEISGTWQLFLRCQGYSTDAVTFNLDFPTNEAADFSMTGAGTDYDGLAINCEGDLHYDNTTNVLSGNIYSTKPGQADFFRNDSFEVKLAKDDTGYFPMILGEENEAGCAVEGKLINQDTD